MPPVDTAPQSVIRYLTRLLAAQALLAGGELRIPMKAVRMVAAEDNRQALLEDTNIETDELVLRFGSKHSAVYPVDPEPCDSPKPRSATSQTIPQSSLQPNGPTDRTTGRPPLTEEQINQMEQKLRQMKAVARMRSAVAQVNSSEASEPNFPV